MENPINASLNNVSRKSISMDNFYIKSKYKNMFLSEFIIKEDWVTYSDVIKNLFFSKLVFKDKVLRWCNMLDFLRKTVKKSEENSK